MKEAVDKLMFVLLPLLILGVVIDFPPFIVILAILCFRLVFMDKHTAGLFLLMFGGQLGGCIRHYYPFLPIYGLLLNAIGALLLWDQLYYLKKEADSVKNMAIILVFFFFAFFLSPNVLDYYAINKVLGIVLHGFLMFLGYFAFIHSPNISAERLFQCLIITSVLFLVSNMQLLNIAPSSFMDYVWLRNGFEIVLEDGNEDLAQRFVNYQVIGMNALYGIAIYLSQLNLNKKKALIYSFYALQVILTAGARQAIFGFLIIVVLRYSIFTEHSLQSRNVNSKIKSQIIGALLVYLMIQVLGSIGIDYITDTLEEGDKTREMLKNMGLDLFIQNPVFGTGIGGFNHAYPGMLFPHNFIVELLCECGIIGVLFLSFFVIIHFSKQKMTILYLTKSNSFPFLIVMALSVRIMVSTDLQESIEVFSAIFACSLTANGNNKYLCNDI